MEHPRTPWADRLFFALVLGAAVFALVMHYGIARTDLSRKQWAVPAQYIAKHFQPGDAIVLLPSWALKGAEQLRHAFNKRPGWKRKPIPVLLYEHPSKEDFSRYKRLWVLHAPYLGKWWFVRSFTGELQQLQRRFWRKRHKRFEQLEVSLLQLPKPLPILVDFSALRTLRRAEVRLVQPATSRKQARRSRCRYAPVGRVSLLRRWRQRPGWFEGRRRYFFGRLIHEVGDTPRDCLHARPLRCQTLHVRYPNVPLRGLLKLEHGIGTPAPGGIAPSIKPGGDKVEIEVWVEQKRLGKFTLHKENLWKTHWLNLSRHQWSRKRGSVEFRIQTPGRRNTRSGYCFRARLQPVLAKKPNAKAAVKKTVRLTTLRTPVRKLPQPAKVRAAIKPVPRSVKQQAPVLKIGPGPRKTSVQLTSPVVRKTPVLRLKPVLPRTPTSRPAPASRPSSR
jgi:hypothetical protein